MYEFDFQCPIDEWSQNPLCSLLEVHDGVEWGLLREELRRLPAQMCPDAVFAQNDTHRDRHRQRVERVVVATDTDLWQGG